MRIAEQPNGRSRPVNEHLGEHELPNQEDEPMEEPEKAGAGAMSASPEYGDPMEAEALMEEAKEAGAGAQKEVQGQKKDWWWQGWPTRETER